MSTTLIEEGPGESAATGTLFRFATAGSVDDGKSTLVGRLLHDAKAILADQLEAVARTSTERGFGGADGGLDLALLTDGLRAEREQGITIDVAYRYFATDRRSFILADCPGHVQYTRNTVTGASTADAVVVLIDARKGVLEQTRRHLSVLALLRTAHVIVAVNKIDLVDYSREVFEDIEREVLAVSERLGITGARAVPVSALLGDNIAVPSELTDWYTGPTLLGLLETLPTQDEVTELGLPFRFPVQTVLRPQGALAPGLAAEDYRDYRAYAGQVSSGSIGLGDSVSVLSSGQPPRNTTIEGIDTADGPRQAAAAPASVALRLGDDVDISRGDTIVSGPVATPRREFAARLCWLGQEPLAPGAKVLIKHGTATVRGLVTSVEGLLDLETSALVPADTLELNDIGSVGLSVAAELPVEDYAANRRAGSLLVIDPQTGNTVAAGLVISS
ncbi:MAG: sulfate adenylyltransferase subunit 1 [Arthrobacter sp.]|uniref:sulfate adenylyltransferase subunit 1 n=1 Tax=unclassified Arthrobacter TaxID=235627 RepID=UPI00264A5D10|nr:GTP-binding protein [Micrococcaceae bacterium]MDN5814052.1 GTP-binding protein [Micrococcaceae bacterium]MDN5887852.1 GTP-binding protein [Micrococcaceae bacterium]MDN5906298.1 GTP-binding protein [Micrococcaceae bacterium]